ncbi:MAG TPA: glycosyltransferase [Anaerolineae bacterium]
MAETKRIVILMADAGFGHRSAAQALAAALRGLYGEQCSVEIVNPMDDERVPGLLRGTQTNYDRLVREMPGLYRASYEMSDAAVPSAVAGGALAAGLFETLRDIVHSHQPDAIISVHPQYLAPLAAVFSRDRRHIPVATVVTDLVTVHHLWFNKVSDVCLVATEEAQQVAVRDGLPAEKVKITGIPVNPQLSQDTRPPAAIRAELGWQPDLATVLVAGSKRTENTLDVLHALNHSGLPVQLAVVAGGDDELYRRLQYTEWHRVAHVYNFVDNMPTLLRAADCVLAKAGGLIVSEALACGRPLLLAGVIEGQETGNASYVVEHGAGEMAKDPVAAMEILCHWLDHDGLLLRERTEKAIAIGRPRAAYEIAEQVWALAQKGPAPLPENRRIALPKNRAGLIGKDAAEKDNPGGTNDPAN